MRAALGCGLLLLSACQGGDEPDRPAATEAAKKADDKTIECALDGAADFTATCSVDRVEVEGTRYLIVRHPDGGFRRFEVLEDGHGLAVADGADAAKLTVRGEILEAAVDNDRYRFPVTLKGTDAGR